jgi:hypothetical protein
MRNQTFKHNVIQEETYISTLRNTGKNRYFSITYHMRNQIFEQNITHEKSDI